MKLYTYLNCFHRLVVSDYDVDINRFADFLVFDSYRKGYPQVLQESIHTMRRCLRSGSYKRKRVFGIEELRITVFYDVSRLITHNTYSGISLTTWKLNQIVSDVPFLKVVPVFNPAYLPSGYGGKDLLRFEYIDLGEIQAYEYRGAIEASAMEERIYHSAYYPIPNDIPYDVKKVITLYDIIHLTHREFYPDPTKFITSKIAESCLSADMILAISEYSAEQLVSYIGKNVPTVIMPLAPTITSYKEESVPDFRDGNGPRTLSFAYQGGDPRKNFTRMLSISEKWIQQKDTNTVCIFGNIESLKEKYIENTLLSSKQVDLVQVPNDAELARIYANSGIYLYLSEMEGFGLPPLEAMQFGCPAIMLKNSSLQEVFQGWPGLMENESSDEAILIKINKLIDMDGIRQESYEFSSNYSWDVTLCLALSGYLTSLNDHKIG